MSMVNVRQQAALREFRRIPELATWRAASDAKIDALIAEPLHDFIEEGDRDSLELQETVSLRYRLQTERNPLHDKWVEIFRRHMAA